VVKVDSKRKREIVRQIKATNRRNTGSISRFGNAELCGKDPLSTRRDFRHGLLAVLFTPFFSTKADGRGLGLTLVREILVHHKAPFSLSGPPGGPTRFAFSLPQVAEGQPL